MSKLRFKALEDACSHKPVAVATPTERPSVFFGKMVFTREKMKEYMKAYIKEIDEIKKLIQYVENNKECLNDE